MNRGYSKYQPAKAVSLKDRTWPDKVIDKAPRWCSVDLRDGNQALVNPMSVEQKLLFFKTLVDIGFKEIELGFPASSETEFEAVRAIIDGGLIPDDVTIQVLVQSREHLIRRTFEAVRGAKNVVLNFYNSISELHRRVVFDTDIEGICKIAVDAAKLIKELSEEEKKNSGMNIRYEYSPENFSQTDIESSLYICNRVIEVLQPTAKRKMIINLPSTVENETPNIFADQIEFMSRKLNRREAIVLSIHPHNDRGTAVAASELALMAGAERVEGTLFGNGERTGNGDIMTIALNMYTQGVDTGLDFSEMNSIKRVYEECTGMEVHERHPYAGKLVFTAFSGSHQDAINKGINYIARHELKHWEVPYLPIDPADLGRQFEPIVRINSQSGKGGAAFVMQQSFGYYLPEVMRMEFSHYIQQRCDSSGTELKPQEILDIFKREYVEVKRPYDLRKYRLFEENSTDDDVITVDFEGLVSCSGKDYFINGKGNGPIDAFFTALKCIGVTNYEFLSYNEHAVSSGADSKAVSYIQLKYKNRDTVFGVGIDSNISLASIKGIVAAINRNEKLRQASLEA